MRRTATIVFLGPVHKTPSGWGYTHIQADSKPILIEGGNSREVHKERRSAAEKQGFYLISSHDLFNAIMLGMEEAHSFGKMEAVQLIAQNHEGSTS